MLLVQRRPLNRITLEQRQTDSKSNLELVILDKFDPINNDPIKQCPLYILYFSLITISRVVLVGVFASKKIYFDSGG
jgi:hypothetical protein